MARRPSPADTSLETLPDGNETTPAGGGPASLAFDAYLAGNNTSRQALGAGGQDGEAWLCLEVSQDAAAEILRSFHLLTGRSFHVTIEVR